MDVTEQKLAEKLTVLNDRGIGLLTRLYNIKKSCGDVKSKPGFLSEKSLEPSIKFIVKRFPNIDYKQVPNIAQYRSEINKTLQLYYYTFIDILDFKNHVSELLAVMDSCHMELDITLNYDLTKGYLDLVVTYVTLMILISRVEDKKAVLGLYHAAQEMANHPDDNFLKLGQMILEYDPPMKRLSEEFAPHSNLLVKALQSLQSIYPRRNLEAETLREKQMLSLTAQPGNLLIPARTDTTPCEILSLDIVERWIILGFTLCHQVTMSQVDGSSDNMWLSALRSSWVITLFRDEVLYIHQFIVTFFDGIKGYGKRVFEVKETLSYAIANAALIHRERRKFYRPALKELALVLTDQPGLLGPKALYVFMGLCYARDEVAWLVRHYDNPPHPAGPTLAIKAPIRNKVSEELTDRELPELLFHMEELRALVRKYSQIIQRYHVPYLAWYDGPALEQLLPNYVGMETEFMILNYICTSISTLCVKQVEDGEIFDFRGMRHDWYRLQSFISKDLGRNKELFCLMNNTTFHLKLVDFQDELLSETSDLSDLYFYSRMFEEQFQMCLEFPAQNRYIVAFPLICSHFENVAHDMCPEERPHIRDQSLSMVNMFLDEMAKEATNIIIAVCDQQCNLEDKLLPKHCATSIAHHLQRKKGKGKNKKRALEAEVDKPGVESIRKTREDLTTMDKLHMALTELSFSINYCPTISVWAYTFAPKEYLHQLFEKSFAHELVTMVKYNPEKTNEIAKPSELLSNVRAYMNVMQSVENYGLLDMTPILNSVLQQQMQQEDKDGKKTVAFLYKKWYTEVLLRRVFNGSIIFSMSRRALVNFSPDPSFPFSSEEYSDVTELRALVELIGPLGMKHISEAIMCKVASELHELKKLTAENREVLTLLRENFDKPEIMKDLSKKLQNADNAMLRMTIIGMILRFQQSSQEALHDVLEDKIPFLFSSILNFNEHSSSGDSMNAAEVMSTAGIQLKVDPTLLHILQENQKADATEGEYQLSCLLMVFVAVSVPRLARMDTSIYRSRPEGQLNNMHCLATAINTVFGTLFSVSGTSDVEERMKEFLALTSSSMLRLAKEEADKDAIKNRESVYLLLDMIVRDSPFLTMDLLESCFPCALIRNAIHKLDNYHIS